MFAFLWSVVRADGSIIASAGADSRIVFWEDKTEEARVAQIQADQVKVEQEQHLDNLLRAEKLLPALEYAITLNRPFKVLKILESKLNTDKTNRIRLTSRYLLQLSTFKQH